MKGGVWGCVFVSVWLECKVSLRVYPLFCSQVERVSGERRGLVGFDSELK